MVPLDYISGIEGDVGINIMYTTRVTLDNYIIDIDNSMCSYLKHTHY